MLELPASAYQPPPGGELPQLVPPIGPSLRRAQKVRVVLVTPSVSLCHALPSGIVVRKKVPLPGSVSQADLPPALRNTDYGS
jgi:hypothetical protein